MPTHLIIKTGEKLPSLATVAGDYEDWMARIAGWGSSDYRVVAVYLGEALPPLDEVSSIVITGAGAMVTDQDAWISRSSEWLARAAEQTTPILGICFGHQLLAHALGGQVDYNPRGVEVGTVTIELTAAASKDSLFSHMPRQFRANVSHMQSVIQLPAGAELLAYSEMEPVHAFRYGDHIWGVQFHPEFDGEIVQHFIRYYQPQLQQEARAVAPMLEGASDTPQSRSLLERFARLDSNY